MVAEDEVEAPVVAHVGWLCWCCAGCLLEWRDGMVGEISYLIRVMGFLPGCWSWGEGGRCFFCLVISFFSV